MLPRFRSCCIPGPPLLAWLFPQEKATSSGSQKNMNGWNRQECRLFRSTSRMHSLPKLPGSFPVWITPATPALEALADPTGSPPSGMPSAKASPGIPPPSSSPGMIGAAGMITSCPQGGRDGLLGYGLRVPLLLASPWARHGYVSHTVHEAIGFITFIEHNFNLGSLGQRDESADDFADCFDFTPLKAPFVPVKTGTPSGD